MLRFVFQKMLANRWMTACLIIGNLFLCAVAAAIPIYTDATMNRVLQTRLEEIPQEQEREAGAVMVKAEARIKEVILAMDDIQGEVEDFTEAMELDVLSVSRWQFSDPYKLISGAVESLGGDEVRSGSQKLQLTWIEDYEAHIEILSGRGIETPMEDGVIEAVISETTMISQNLLVGDVVELEEFEYQEGVNWKVRITGVYRTLEDKNFWQADGDALEQHALVDESVLYTLYVEPQTVRYRYTQYWYFTLDASQMDARRGEDYLAALEQLKTVKDYSSSMVVDAAFDEVLQEQNALERKLVVTLLILMVPILVLLAFFIFMVSKQTLELEKNTISVLESRGAGRGQIIGVFAMQSAFVALVCGIIGIPLGSLLCRIFGSAGGYMQFVQREPLPVRITWDTLGYVGIAVVVSMLTMVVPAVLCAGVSIVENKRDVFTHGLRWKRVLPSIGLDLLLLGVAFYGWYTFQNQVDTLAASAEKQIDPLIFLSSSLFIFSAGLLISQLIPLAIHLVYRIGRNRWKPVAYTAFLRVMRAAGDQRFIMVFLVLTVSIGVFNARTARTLEENVEDNIRYENGADMVLQEAWGNNITLDTDAFVKYQEPVFARYETFAAQTEDVQLTKVLNTTDVSVSGAEHVRVMGIHTAEFGRIAYMREALLPAHWYNYLNAMATDASAVLLSTNWHTELGYELGQAVTIRNTNGTGFTGVVVGFVDYWPTYLGETEPVYDDGEWVSKPEYLVVGSLSKMQSVWGVMPYEIWTRTEDTGAVYDFIAEQDMKLKKLVDTKSDIYEASADPVLQGVYGFMTVGFALVLLVCITGFLIFWILSIRGRILQIGILRAMGMGLRELLGMLLSEQVLISLTSALAGFGVGWGASELYAQLMQLSFSGEFSALPLQVSPAIGDCIAIGIAVVGMFIACMLVLRGLVQGVHLILAVNRGED